MSNKQRFIVIHGDSGTLVVAKRGISAIDGTIQKVTNADGSDVYTIKVQLGDGSDFRVFFTKKEDRDECMNNVISVLGYE